METKTMTADQARIEWSTVITNTFKGICTIVTRYGKPTSVVMPYDQWAEHFAKEENQQDSEDSAE